MYRRTVVHPYSDYVRSLGSTITSLGKTRGSGMFPLKMTEGVMFSLGMTGVFITSLGKTERVVFSLGMTKGFKKFPHTG